jgi:hypothetical protein
MFDKIKNVFSSSELEGLTGDDQEVLLALLIYTKFADGTIKLSEDKKIEDKLEGLEWQSNQSVQSYIGAVTARIRSILGDEDQTMEFLKEMAGKTSSPEVNKIIYENCFELAVIDNDFDEKEMNFIDHIKDVFGVKDED